MAFLLLLWTSLIAVSASGHVEYNDLQVLGASCRPKDTCNRPVLRFPNISCECDSRCSFFDDCCIDAPFHRGGVHKSERMVCHKFASFQGVYTVDKCVRSFNGPLGLKRKCEKPDYNDPLFSLLATDAQTSVTYRNRYCAECNNVNLNNLLSWAPTLMCDSLKSVNEQHRNVTQEFIEQNIAHVRNEWGVYHWNQSGNAMAFYPCDISSSLPDHVARYARYCVPEMVSTCATNWNRQPVQRKCDSYTAVVYVNGQAYRNVHCALCNHGTVNNIQCSAPFVNGRDKPSLSFTLLLDVNSSDGNQVGSTQACPSGQKFDPFFKKCRPLVCALPGYVMRNGKCVRR